MLDPEIHAAQATLDYAKLDAAVGRLTDDTAALQELLADADDRTRDAFRIALHVMGNCRRRLLTLAAALRRIELGLATGPSGGVGASANQRGPELSRTRHAKWHVEEEEPLA